MEIVRGRRRVDGPTRGRGGRGRVTSRLRLTDVEAWEALARAHTGIFVSLRRDGAPVALDAKYRMFRAARTAMPAATRAYYDAAQATIEVDPDARFLTWGNARLSRDES